MEDGKEEGVHSQQQKAWIRTHCYVPEMLMKPFLGSKYCQSGGVGRGVLSFLCSLNCYIYMEGRGWVDEIHQDIKNGKGVLYSVSTHI